MEGVHNNILTPPFNPNCISTIEIAVKQQPTTVAVTMEALCHRQQLYQLSITSKTMPTPSPETATASLMYIV